MEDISIVEVAARQVIGIKKTGTCKLIPELLLKVHEYTVKKKMIITGPPVFICHGISRNIFHEFFQIFFFALLIHKPTTL
jgi:hypothetical protein